MYLYRIEHKNGLGPYNSSKQHRITFCARTCNHPTPTEDNLDMFNSKYRCGFSSLKQLLYWFHKADRHQLKSAGFKLYRLKVEEGYKGNYQAIYIKNSYKIESELDLINPRFKTRVIGEK